MKTLTISPDGKTVSLEDGTMTSIPLEFFDQYQTTTILNLNLRSCQIIHSFDFFYLTQLQKIHIVAISLEIIESLTFRPLWMLTDLFIEAPELEAMPTYLFSSLRNLMKITLIIDNVTSINTNTFINNTALEELSLKSSIFEFTPRHFNVIRQLRVCKISHCPVIGRIYLFIDCSHFKEFKDLHTIHLNRVYCLQFQIPPSTAVLKLIECGLCDADFFTKLANLTYLDLSGCSLQLKPHQLAGNLKTVILTENILDILIENDFDALKNLLYLDLSGCGIWKVFDNFLGHASLSINYLKLDSNRIYYLLSDSFRNCDRLFTLDLSNNNLEMLQKHIFDRLYNLTLLDLHDNKLISLPNSIFFNLNVLKYLNLSSNFIRVTRTKWFRSNETYSLEKLDFSSNEIQHIRNKSLNMLTNLKNLNLSCNTFRFLKPYYFENLTNLTELNLSNNQIEVLINEIFNDLKYLVVLKLQDNIIDHIEGNVFRPLINLKILNLMKNLLHDLDGQLLNMNRQLTTIYLNKNNLVTIPERFFYYLDNLENLHINANNLTVISERCFEHNLRLRLLCVDDCLKPVIAETLPNVIFV